MPRACPSSARMLALAALPALSAPAAADPAIDCGKIGTAYDALFSDVNKRVDAVLAESKAPPGNAGEPRKEAVRKRFCAVGGELVGYYRFVLALANDCTKQGASLDKLIDLATRQLELARGSVKQVCE